jgi:hypothetical protein
MVAVPTDALALWLSQGDIAENPRPTPKNMKMSKSARITVAPEKIAPHETGDVAVSAVPFTNGCAGIVIIFSTLLVFNVLPSLLCD